MVQYLEKKVSNPTPGSCTARAPFIALWGELPSAVSSAVMHFSWKGNQTLSKLTCAEIRSCWSYCIESSELCALKTILKRSIFVHREPREVKSGFMRWESTTSVMAANNGKIITYQFTYQLCYYKKLTTQISWKCVWNKLSVNLLRGSSLNLTTVYRAELISPKLIHLHIVHLFWY